MSYRDQAIKKRKQEVSKWIGAEEFKRYVDELCGIYERLQKGSEGVLYERALLLSVSEGDGLKQWVNTLADLWSLLLGQDAPLPVKNYTLKLPDLMDAGDARKTSERDIVLHKIEADGILESFMGLRILCVDITDWIERVEGAEFRAVLSRLKLSMAEQFVVFRIPPVDEVTLRRIKEAIGWFMNVDELYCPPYAMEDYLTYAMQRFERLGVQTEKGVREDLGEILSSEMRSPEFCGFQTMRRITDEMIFTSLRNTYGEKHA